MKALRAVAGLGRRVMSTKAVGEIPSTSRYQKLQKKQTLFCRNDGLLVWQKLGMRDNLPYQITMALTAFAYALSCYKIILMSLPKKE